MSEDAQTDRQPNRHMLAWLSDVCTEAREAAGVSREQVAAIGHLSYSLVYRFEAYADRWPRNIDHLLAAYAAACGLADPRVFFLRAVERWMRHGRPLVLVDGEVQDGTDEVPKSVLKDFEEAIGAYVRELEPAESRTARASRGTRRAASSKRVRP